MAARGVDLEMVQALLRHDRIDVSVRNRYSEDPLMLAVKDGHFPIVDALVVNPGLKYFSLKRSLDLARDDCIQRAIRSRMEDANTRQRLLKRSPGRRFGGLEELTTSTLGNCRDAMRDGRVNRHFLR